MAKQKLNTKTSIVDYLKSVNKDSSYASRKKLAQQYGITDYSGTAGQNTSLLKTLKSGANTNPNTDVKKDNKAQTNNLSVPKAVEQNPLDYKPADPILAPTSQGSPSYEANRPEAYQSPYSSQIDSLLSGILNRQPFNYNMNADPLYKQYKDQYTREGNLAMRDTMGNASGLTGGYGSSYGGVVGQQAYDSHLQQLNNVAPELYNAAYGRYQNDQANDVNNLNMLQNMDQKGYSQYRDSVGDFESDRSYGYGKDVDAQQQQNWLDSFLYGQGQDQQSQSNWQDQFDYGVSQDELGQQNYLKEFAYQQAQDNVKQSNWSKEYGLSKGNADRNYSLNQDQFNYGKEQDTLDRNQSLIDASQQSEKTNQEASQKRVTKYTGEVKSMLKDMYSPDDALDYLLGLDLSDDEIAIIVNDVYDLRKLMK